VSEDFVRNPAIFPKEENRQIYECLPDMFRLKRQIGVMWNKELNLSKVLQP